MEELDNLRQVRLDKLTALTKLGINSFPAESQRTHTASQARENFSVLFKGKKKITLAGRLMSKREHGGLIFSEIKDDSGIFQVLFKKDELKDRTWVMLTDLIDIGDLLETSGTLFVTKKNEKTLLVSKFKILAKSLRPLPEKWYGLADHETRFRQRYLDLLMNPEVKERFITRHKLVQAIREFLIKAGFIEVDTPALQPLPGGALATPFKTHYAALDTDIYLRIAPELYLKRLIVGGFEKVFEFARVFRNEGISTQHLQDFTMLEFYQAYSDYVDLMKFTEQLLTTVIKRVLGTTKIKYQSGPSTRFDRACPERSRGAHHKSLRASTTVLNFEAPWPRKSLREVIKKETGIDIDKYPTVKDLQAIIAAKKIKLVYTGKTSRGKLIDELYKETVRPKLINPIFLIDYPLDLSPLAKKKVGEVDKVQRFQLVVAGMEIVNAFSELNDPLDQVERFSQQARNKKAGDSEAHSMDDDYVKALEYGMPPTAGFGMGIDRLVALLTNADSIREAVLFPFVKPR